MIQHENSIRSGVLRFYRVKTILIILISYMVFISSPELKAISPESYVSIEKKKGYFHLVSGGLSTPVYISSSEDAGIIRAAHDLQEDINRISGITPILCIDSLPLKEKQIVIIGTLGKNALFDRLVNQNKLHIREIVGKWESFVIEVIENPLPGIDHALVIAGSDKRGTIFGIYDLSEQIGVSPWYWWADIPVKKKNNIFIKPGRYTRGEPAVKYRGIFINDEAPALSGWVYEKFGGFNHQFYEHVFELILRLKGNYLWPAMWGKAFYVDDTLNAKLADEYGVVIGTSHHEPMMRAHHEWSLYGSGKWNYEVNKEELREFWKEGIQRMNDYESIVTIGMRGDGDEPMTEGTAIALLEKIVQDQREILEEVTGEPADAIPQKWALYKEVQDYYDKGMRVPDDVTLLLCDDNWGNIRKLPALGDSLRSGGYGIYYHYDYVGGPRNYKWLNTSPIPRVWEQMHLAYQYKADRYWIVNVGDIKPLEFPISFFLDYAWDPELWPAEKIGEYTKLWAEQQFGKEYAEDISIFLSKYLKFNGRRKPELLGPETYSVINYREADRIVDEYNTLARDAQKLYEITPAEYKDAYYQLVLHPILACSNLNELYVSIAKNYLYAQQGRAATSDMAQKARELFINDSLITEYYNHTLSQGKWNHFMDQTHIGYTYWQEPPSNSMPVLKEAILSAEAEMGIAIEGSDKWWPGDSAEAKLPELSPYSQNRTYVDVYNRGTGSFEYSIATELPWLKIEPAQGMVEKEQRVWIGVEWLKVQDGKIEVPITIKDMNGKQVIVYATINKPENTDNTAIEGFVENNGYVSIEAEHFTRKINSSQVQWQIIPDLGRTLSAISPFPVTASKQTPGSNSPHLEYDIYLFTKGQIKVHMYFAPTLNFHNTEGLFFAVSFDDEIPQVINFHQDSSFQTWEKNVADNIAKIVSEHNISQTGKHTLKFWMVDPAIVLQKIIVETTGLQPSYLGPQESIFCNGK